MRIIRKEIIGVVSLLLLFGNSVSLAKNDLGQFSLKKAGQQRQEFCMPGMIGPDGKVCVEGQDLQVQEFQVDGRVNNQTSGQGNKKSSTKSTPSKKSSLQNIPKPISEQKDVEINIEKIRAMRDAVEGEQIGGNAFLVRPERTTIIELSSTDINRIVCSDGTEEMRLIFSKKKGVTAKIIDNNAFIEFEAKLEKDGDEEKIHFQKNPTEFYVFCDSTIFSIIAFPKQIPAVTVYLDNKLSRLKKERERFEALPFEERLIEIIKTIMSGKVPLQASVIKVGKEINISQSPLEVREISKYIFEAEGLVARTFEVKLKENIDKQFIDLRERDFIRSEIVTNPLAVSLSQTKISKGSRVLLVIVEKMKLSFGEDVAGGFYMLEGKK